MASFRPSSPSSSSSTSSGSSSSSSSDSESGNEAFSRDARHQNAPPLNVQASKTRYRKTKVQLLEAIRSNELLKEELKRYQKLLLRLNQDKYFLFERLMTHEKPPPKNAKKNTEISSGSQPTQPIVGETKVPKKRGPKPKKKLQDERLTSSKAEESSSRPPLPAGQSLLKLKLPAQVSDKSDLVFRSPDSRKGHKRKIVEDASSSEADHLFREAAAKTTEQVPDQLFE